MSSTDLSNIIPKKLDKEADVGALWMQPPGRPICGKLRDVATRSAADFPPPDQGRYVGGSMSGQVHLDFKGTNRPGMQATD